MDETQDRNSVQNENSDYFMTTQEVMRFLNVSRTKIWSMVKNQGLPAFKMGSDYRYRYSEVMAWMEQYRIGAHSEQQQQ